MIPEPQRTYILELLRAFGPAAGDFVVAGAQAMKFMLEGTRATKDIDFVLDVVGLRKRKPSIGAKLRELGYKVVDGSRNFQFEKTIPESEEKMRIEFMAPEEFKRANDFRVDVDTGIHAHACTGGSIAIAESAIHPLSGNLPDGSPFETSVRVAKPQALVMLKLLALDERYRNIRGPEEARHDREEARTHAADIIAIVRAQPEIDMFKNNFEQQFHADTLLGLHVLRILERYFRETTSPGILVYEEFIVADKPLDRSARREVSQELDGAHRLMMSLLPVKAFYDLLSAAEDSCDVERNPGLVEEFLNNLEHTRTRIDDAAAIQRLPSTAFGGSYSRGGIFIVSASEASGALSTAELRIVNAQIQLGGQKLRARAELGERFPRALLGKA